MASYLESYGEAEERSAKRARMMKLFFGSLLVGTIAAFVLISMFRNYAEERQVGTFVDLLKKQDYHSAYAMWGCSDANPCRDYSFEKFQADWGPNSPHANASLASVRDGDTCGTGVMVPVDFKGLEQVPLWVDRGTKTIGFSPDPECRKKHWHFRAFFRSLFNKSSIIYPLAR